MGTKTPRKFCIAQYSGNGLYATTSTNGAGIFTVKVENKRTAKFQSHSFDSREKALTFAQELTLDVCLP